MKIQTSRKQSQSSFKKVLIKAFITMEVTKYMRYKVNVPGVSVEELLTMGAHNLYW